MYLKQNSLKNIYTVCPLMLFQLTIKYEHIYNKTFDSTRGIISKLMGQYLLHIIYAGMLRYIHLKYWYVIVDLGPVLLGHTLGYPHDVTTLLFLELQIWIEHSKMELLQESHDIQFYLNISDKNLGHNTHKAITSCSKNLSSSVLSPGLFPAPSNSLEYSA